MVHQNFFPLGYISSWCISFLWLVFVYWPLDSPKFLMKIKGEKANMQFCLKSYVYTCCGPKPVVNNSSSCFVRTVIDFGASSHLALSSHFLRVPVKMRRGTNVNRGRFHRTMGDSRTIRLNVETATQSVPRWCMQIFGKTIQHSNTSKNWPILGGNHI